MGTVAEDCGAESEYVAMIDKEKEIAIKKLLSDNVNEFILVIRRKDGRLDWVNSGLLNDIDSYSNLVKDFAKIRRRIAEIPKEKRNLEMLRP